VLGLALACGGGPDPAVADQAYQESVAAIRGRDYPSAIEAANRAVAADPTHLEAWMNLGIAHSRSQNWTEAIEAYTRVTELDPGNEKALNNVANVYFRQGRYDEAATWYRRALDVDPDYLLATFHYGWVLRQLNRLDEAEQAFDHCKEIPPANDRERQTQLDCHFYLGSIRFRRGDYAAAAGFMEDVLSVFPAHSEARHFLGLSYRKMGRMEDAARQLEIHRELLRAGRAQTIPEPVD
jgi:Flp pilus assembly protein TadD